MTSTRTRGAAAGPRSKASGFDRALERYFPGAIEQKEYAAVTAGLLGDHGFDPGRTLVCVAVCRDELAGPFVDTVEDVWGGVFSLASLGGMLTAGRTGVSAALHHAPVHRGKRRLVLFAMPHIAIGDDGRIGQVRRPGVPEPSVACGALSALQGRSVEGEPPSPLDPLDIEQALLARRLSPAIEGTTADLLALTLAAADAIEDDLWELFHDVFAVDGGRRGDALQPSADGAMFTGIQIHGPGGRDFVWPRSGYLSVGAELYRIDREAPSDPARRDGDGSGRRGRRLGRWLARGAVASTVVVLVGARRELDRP